MGEQAIAKIPRVVLSAALKDVLDIGLDLDSQDFDLKTSRAVRELLADETRREDFYRSLDKRWRDWQGDVDGEYPKQPGPLLLLDEGRQFDDALDQVDPTGTPSALENASAETDARSNLLIERIQALTVIPRDLAFEIAETLSWFKIRDASFIATRKAPVMALSTRTLTRFQLPLAIYFREELKLADPVVEEWVSSTLSIQLRTDGARFSVNALPDGWSVAVAFEHQPPVVLDTDSRHHEIRYAGTVSFEHRLAIVPFGAASKARD